MAKTWIDFALYSVYVDGDTILAKATQNADGVTYEAWDWRRISDASQGAFDQGSFADLPTAKTAIQNLFSTGQEQGQE